MWICKHCNVENQENSDLCWLCEACGCLLDEHYCGGDEEDPA
jgi:hypothetical protein